jgi:outer membrane protein OmpU
MKKQLIGTTALVSAGLLAAAGADQRASAAEPLSLSVGGYFSVAMQFRDEDDSIGDPGANLQEFGVYNDGEIQFTATTTLDNGIGVKARIEYEAFNQGLGTSTSDERYLDFSGGFGILRIGSDDDAAYGMQYQAPVGAYQIGVNTPTFAIPAVGKNQVSSYPTTYAGINGDTEKVIWFSPRISGFQLGLSYAPDDSTNDVSEETGGFPGIPKLDNEPGAQEDIISVGLNFVETFNDVDIAIAGGYVHGNKEAQGTVGSGTGVFEDQDTWSAGINVGLAGFAVGGSIRGTDQGLDIPGGADTLTWDAGATYSNGPLTLGFTYLRSEQEIGAAGEDELDSFLVSGNYNLGPGVDVWGGVKFYDYQSDTNLDPAENDGFIISVGSSVSF